MSAMVGAKAAVTDLPVETIGGKEYYVYIVKKGEGKISVAKNVGLPFSQIESYNPEVNSGLKVGQRLLLPKEVFAPRAMSFYMAKKGDSVYGISKRFGMTQDEFIELNPEALHSIEPDRTYKVYSVDSNVVSSVPVSNQSQDGGMHTIADGETLYSLAAAQGCSVGDILALNPGLDIAHYEIGDKIHLPAKKARADIYTVLPKENFYSISRKFGISVEQLQSANPGVNILKEGQTIVIPQACAEEQDDNVASPATEPDSIPVQIVDISSQELPKVSDAGRVTVALVLPFMTDAKEKSRQAKAYADFYRGFMIGVDTLKQAGNPITVIAFDTQDSSEKLTTILNDSIMMQAQVIIGSDSNAELSRLANFASRHGSRVLNLFSTKDSSYMTNASMLQANIPYEEMVRKAIDYKVPSAYGKKIVILRKKTLVDKLEVVDALLAKLRAEGITPMYIDYTDKFTEENLSALDRNASYVFVPNSGKVAEATDILESIVKFKTAGDGLTDVEVWGYPEWIALKGKALEDMKNANTVIYSRFSNDASDPAVVQLDSQYQKWYGNELPAGVPRQTLTGYDAAVYLIRSLAENDGKIPSDGTAFEGVQLPFHFVIPAGGAGLVNDAMYLINFRPSGIIEKITL